MSKTLILIALGTATLSGCAQHEMTAPNAVQEATAGQDNREIVFPLALIGGLTFWGVI